MIFQGSTLEFERELDFQKFELRCKRMTIASQEYKERASNAEEKAASQSIRGNSTPMAMPLTSLALT